MNQSGKRQTTTQRPFIGAAVPDPTARWLLGMGPHPMANRPPAQPKKPKGLLGPSLQLATASSLLGESFLHGMSQGIGRQISQLGIGVAQRGIGTFGAVYYGMKAREEGGISNYLKAAGYTAFGIHGYARMVEGHLQHARHTAATGVLAAGMKAAGSGPMSFPGFIADMAANVVEYGHSVHHHPKSVWQSAVGEATHQVRSAKVRQMQIFAAVALGASSVYDMYSHVRAKK